MIDWAKMQWGPVPPSCGASSSKRETAIHCELPPDHLHVSGEKFTHHVGRDRLGRYRWWPVTP